MSNIKAVWAVNSSVAMGLAALARPPHDLTVCFIKYNTGLDCVCVECLRQWSNHRLPLLGVAASWTYSLNIPQCLTKILIWSKSNNIVVRCRLFAGTKKL